MSKTYSRLTEKTTSHVSVLICCAFTLLYINWKFKIKKRTWWLRFKFINFLWTNLLKKSVCIIIHFSCGAYLGKKEEFLTSECT